MWSLAIALVLGFSLGLCLSLYLILQGQNFPLVFLKKISRRIRKKILAEDVLSEPIDFWNTDRIFLSYYPVTVVFSLRRVGGRSPENPVIKSVSPQANQFYGYSCESSELIEKDASFLIERIRPWMNPEDYRAFIEDQQILLTHCLSKDIKHDEMFARIPILFNHEHPHDSYRGKTFLPIIVFIKEEKYGITIQDWLTILYLDIDKLPRELVLDRLQTISEK